jgi:hypothetical protein
VGVGVLPQVVIARHTAIFEHFRTPRARCTSTIFLRIPAPRVYVVLFRLDLGGPLLAGGGPRAKLNSYADSSRQLSQLLFRTVVRFRNA